MLGRPPEDPDATTGSSGNAKQHFCLNMKLHSETATAVTVNIINKHIPNPDDPGFDHILPHSPWTQLEEPLCGPQTTQLHGPAWWIQLPSPHVDQPACHLWSSHPKEKPWLKTMSRNQRFALDPWLKEKTWQDWTDATHKKLMTNRSPLFEPCLCQHTCGTTPYAGCCEKVMRHNKSPLKHLIHNASESMWTSPSKDPKLRNLLLKRDSCVAIMWWTFVCLSIVQHSVGHFVCVMACFSDKSHKKHFDALKGLYNVHNKLNCWTFLSVGILNLHIFQLSTFLSWNEMMISLSFLPSSKVNWLAVPMLPMSPTHPLVGSLQDQLCSSALPQGAKCNCLLPPVLLRMSFTCLSHVQRLQVFSLFALLSWGALSWSHFVCWWHCHIANEQQEMAHSMCWHQAFCHSKKHESQEIVMEDLSLRMQNPATTSPRFVKGAACHHTHYAMGHCNVGLPKELLCCFTWPSLHEWDPTKLREGVKPKPRATASSNVHTTAAITKLLGSHNTQC